MGQHQANPVVVIDAHREPARTLADPLHTDEIGQIVRAIRQGEIDAFVVSGDEGQERIITLHQVEQALRQSEEDYRAMFELSAVGAARNDALTGVFQRVNATFCAITGYSAQELLNGMSFLDLTHPDDRASNWSGYQRLIQGEIPHYKVEKRYLRKDGTIIWVEVTAALVRDRDGAPLHDIAVIHDITERKNAEAELQAHRANLEQLIGARTRELEQTHEQLRVSERMAALGTLSAGLGHDMTNLLMPLRVRLDSLRAQKLSPAAVGDVQAIGQCTEYLSRLVAGLRTFAADPDAESQDESVELAPWWTDVKPFLSIVPPAAVQMEAQIPSDVPPVCIGKSALTQAVFNLVQNATNAITHRAVPRILISAHRDEEGFIRLSVADNGVGMTDEVKNRCMEPFFTTKTRTFSTGLGLSLVHGIIQRAGGRIHIDSSVGKGTTFTLILNAAPKKAEPKRRQPTTACVTVNDTRVNSIIHALLRSLMCDVTDPSPIDRSPSSDSQLWIVDHNDGDDWFNRARSFLRERPGRRVLVINAPPNTQRHFPGLTILPAAAPVADLRATLVDLACPTDAPDHVHASSP